MKKKLIFKNNLEKNKYKYIFLLTIILIGFLSGIILANVLSYNDKKEMVNIVETYFLNLKNGAEVNYLKNLLNISSTNFLYFFLIIIFSLSIIGVLLNPFILYFKIFIIVFSLGIIIITYGFKGILLGIFYVFPGAIINLITYLLLSFHGINLSLKIFKAIFFKKQYNFHEIGLKYLKISLIAILILIISTLYETYLADFIMKLFTFLIK